MEERTWRRGQKADYTDRPLTEEEKRFAEEHHDYIYQFMRSYRLAVSEWYDILIIPYLNAVKKYCSRPELQIYPFPAVAKKFFPVHIIITGNPTMHRRICLMAVLSLLIT